MERTMIKDIRAMAGGTAKVAGFVENFRDGKSMAFIVLKDITGKLQITVEKEKCPELLDGEHALLDLCDPVEVGQIVPSLRHLLVPPYAVPSLAHLAEPHQ